MCLSIGGGLGAHGGFVPVLFRDLVHHFDLGPGDVYPPVHVGIDERQRHLGHAGGQAVARAGEDDVFHARAAQRLGRLLAQHPGDGVSDVGFSAAVRTDNGGDAFAMELQLGAVAERFESQDLQLFQFQHINPFLAGRKSGEEFG